MNVSKVYERLRKEVLRRVRLDKTSPVLLSRQTGLTLAHISNFLNGKRKLSLKSIDKLLEVTRLEVEDLVASNNQAFVPQTVPDPDPIYRFIPVVDSDVAMLNSSIRKDAIRETTRLTAASLADLRDKCSHLRRSWERFVAIRLSEDLAAPMSPALIAGSVVTLDRHYNSPDPYSRDRPTIYAVQLGTRLQFRYVDRMGRYLMITPHNHDYKPELIELKPERTAADVIVGRVLSAMTLTMF